jgi:CelD/BcsL family acetyltransferase involved in cellulose biosynthesis
MQAKTACLANPFLSPEFTIAVGHVRPGARVAVLTDGPQIVGFFPFERRKLGVGVPIAAGLSDCQGVIHAPGAEWQPRMLLRACGMSVWQFDHLVAGQGPFERFQSAVAASPIMDLAHGFDAYHAKVAASSPRFSKDTMRKARKLGRDAGEVRFVADSQDVSLLRTLMAWKSDQYRRTGRMDRFSHPWIVDLLETLLTTRSDHFSGLLSVLHAGDVPVAAHFGLRSGGVLADWFPAYDTSFSRYSPGLILHLRIAEAVAATGVHQIDLGKGYKRYKETLKSYDIFVGEGIVARPSPLAAANYARNAPVAWAIRQVRRHPPLFNAVDAVMQRYGQIRRSLRPLPRPAGGPSEPTPVEAKAFEQVTS